MYASVRVMCGGDDRSGGDGVFRRDTAASMPAEFAAYLTDLAALPTSVFDRSRSEAAAAVTAARAYADCRRRARTRPSGPFRPPSVRPANAATRDLSHSPIIRPTYDGDIRGAIWTSTH